MKTITRFFAAALLAASAAPAFAAPADVALLQTYAGSWRGTGQMTGRDTGEVRCRLTMTPSGDDLSFTGRCTLAGTGSRRFSGIIAYNTKTGRFESRSDSTTVVGRKSGNGIVFSVQDTTLDGDITSTMSLKGGAIGVDFKIVDSKSGKVTASAISFTRS